MSVKLVPTYYSAPNFSIPPPESNGPLQLGSVIANLKDPAPLNPGLLIPIAENEKARTTLKGFSTTMKNSKNVELGIFARILGLDSLGGELGGTLGRSRDEQLFIQSLETQCFNPPLQYMNGVMNLQPVRTFREASRNRLPVYLITGLKVARGASASIVQAKSIGGTGEVGVMDPFAGIASIGPKAAAELSKEHRISFQESSDFVLGYRVTRLKWKKSGTSFKPVTSGATLVQDENATPDDLDGTAEFTHDYCDDKTGSVLDEPGSSCLETSRWVLV